MIFGLKITRPDMIMFGTPYIPVSVAPPSLPPPVGVVLVNVQGRIVGQDDGSVKPSDMPPLTSFASQTATLTTSQNIIDINNDPTHAQTSIAQITADSGGAANGVITLGVYDMNNSKPPASFGDQLLVMGKSVLGAVGGFIAAGPVGAAAGLVSAYGTSEAALIKEHSVNPTNSGAFADGSSITDLNNIGLVGKLVGLGAAADANSGSDIGGAATTAPDLSKATDAANSALSGVGLPDLSSKTGAAAVDIANNGLSVNTLVKAGDAVLPDVTLPSLGDLNLPDVSSLTGVDLTSISDITQLSAQQQQALTDAVSFFNSNPTQQELDAFQTALSGKPAKTKPAATTKTNTPAPAISASGTPAASSGPNPLLLAGLLLLKR